MSIIDRLVASVGYELDPGSEEAKAQYERGLDSMEQGVAALSKAAIAGATILAGYGAAFVGLAVQAAGTLDTLGKVQDTIDGISFERIQGLTFAQKIFGGDESTILSAIDNIQGKINGLKRGEGDFRLFGELGVSFTGDVDDVISRLADRLSTLDINAAQSFGQRLGLDRNFIALLQQGSAGVNELAAEAELLGGVMGRQSADDSAKFNDALLRSSTIIQGIKTRIAVGLLPQITGLIDRFVEFISVNRDAIESGLLVFLDSVATLFTTIGRVLNFVIDLVKDFSDLVGGARNALLALAIGFGALKISAALAAAGSVAALAKIGVAALAANAKLLLVPVLIAAAIGAAALLLQDLFAFLKGEDSAIGAIADDFNAWIEPLTEADTLLGGIVDRVDTLLGFLNLAETGRNIGELAGRVAVSADQGSLGTDAVDVVKSLPGFARFLGEKALGFVGIGTAPSNVQNFGGNASTINQTNNIELTVNGSNLSPDQAQTAVTDGVRSGIALPNGIGQ